MVGIKDNIIMVHGGVPGSVNTVVASQKRRPNRNEDRRFEHRGTKVSQVTTKKEFFEAPINTGLLYEAVKMNRSNKSGRQRLHPRTGRRSAEAARNSEAEAGTGRARVGSIRSPVWRHGGVVFGPHPRDYSYSIPKKAMRQAVRSAVAHKFAEGKLKIFDAIELNAPKTRAALGVFKKAGIESALIVTDVMDRNLMLAVRNLKAFKLTDAKTLNVYDILKVRRACVHEGRFREGSGFIQGVRRKKNRGAAGARGGPAPRGRVRKFFRGVEEMSEIYSIIKAPVITEKATALSAEGNKVVFWDPGARTKRDKGGG